ncbi:MAG: hypothetical protein AABW54_01760 [Candidatus Micrarchaeota archaeon]
MGIFELFGKKKAQASGVFSLRAEVHPYSLKANTNDFVELEIKLENTSDAPQLTSIVVSVPPGLGFERSAISKQREVRLGFLKPGEVKFFKVPLWGTQRTPNGEYPLKIYALAHFNDYAHVLNEVRKVLHFRVD